MLPFGSTLGLQTGARPNVLFIYADDLGYGDTSAYGATRVQTPNIDALAKSGLRFVNGYSATSTCTPSRFATMTGSYAWRKKGTDILPGNAALIVPTDRLTFPKVFKNAGYATGIVGKWHLGLGEKDAEQDWNGEVVPGPREVGFDYSFIMAATGDRVPCVYLENQRIVGLDPKDPLQVSYTKPFRGEVIDQPEHDWLKMRPSFDHNQAIVNGIPRIGYEVGGRSAEWKDEDRADIFTAKAVQFIKDNRAHPFFLYFAPHDIHVPRVPNRRFVGKTKMGPRGDVIVELDWCVGKVVRTLDELGIRDNTLIVLSSDNGPVLDDGYQDRAIELLGSHKPAGPYRGGKYSIFEGGTRMPLIVNWVRHVQPGLSHAMISQVDFVASFADLTGQTLGPLDAPDSFDLLNALLGQSEAGRDEYLEQGATLALREGDWKYVLPSGVRPYDPNNKTEMGTLPVPQLFDLKADPGETMNVAAEHEDITDMLATELKRIREGSGTRPLRNTPPALSNPSIYRARRRGQSRVLIPQGMAHIPAGSFIMGSTYEGFADTLPLHKVALNAFFMDRNLVTNAEFARFVNKTGYVTVEERKPDPRAFPGVPLSMLKPGALVFGPPKRVNGLIDPGQWWKYVAGANWKHPEGPQSSLEGRWDHPVVDVCYADASAYAKWAGKRLPTEAEFEYAARGGLNQAAFAWGDAGPTGRANTFQGQFPCAACTGTSAVASFPPNGYGLYDMAGNVWEWCSDWYRPDYYGHSPAHNPPGPRASYDPLEPGAAKRVLRGGSFLCSAQYCQRYRVGGRGKEEQFTGASNIGFRCVCPG